MCLVIDRNAERNIATDNIPIYKVLEILEGAYYSAYQKYPYTPGVVAHSQLEKDFEYIEIGLHSYEHLQSAKIDVFGWVNPAKYTIFKGYIPKGAEYFMGMYDGHQSYASNQLVLTEEVSE